MDKKKLQALENLVASLEITNAELEEWLYQRIHTDEVFPTKLNLVYRQGNELMIENGLYLARKNEVWGIQLLSGVLVALKREVKNNLVSTTWDDVYSFVRHLRCGRKSGTLPSKYELEKYWGSKEKSLFLETVDVLRKANIDVDEYQGCLWCREEYNFNAAYCFCLETNSISWRGKDWDLADDRIAVEF